MKKRPCFGPGMMFVAVALVLFVLGPLAEILIYPVLSFSPVLSYAILFLPYVLAFLTIYAAGERGDLYLTGKDGRKFSHKRFLLFFSLSFLFLALSSLFEKVAVNEVPLKRKLLSLLFSLLFIPMQTGVEEYLFRVLPVKMIPSWPEKKPNAFFVSVASGLLFMVPHILNPEARGSGGGWALLHYFLWGFLASLSALVSGGFEIPFALHAANNLFVAVAVNYPGSALSSFSFFMAKERTTGALEIIGVLLHFALAFAVFYIIGRRECHEK